MLWPMPGDRYRWTFHADRVGQPTVEDLNTLIRERAPWFPEVQETLHWSAAVHFDRRLAEEFGRGRIWLAGDAAHLTYPMGNQSVNGGLADAEALSNRLAPLLREEGQRAEALEAYSRERLEAWNRTLDPLEELDFEGEPWISRSARYFLASLPGTDRALREQLARLGLA
jgi:2-polyprenyl-6-methoxyphenol hydroxylase-like FAD-dependent oxidoreductase